MPGSNRLLIKVTRDSLPKQRDRFPFLYLERGRLEVDGSSVKWVDSGGDVIPIPVATVASLLLGPGCTVTHEAIKTASSANCVLAWVGEDSLLFYAAGYTPTADTRNFLRQVELRSDPDKTASVARLLFSRRFPKADIEGKSIQEIMGMEGYRVRALYEAKANQYQVGWSGRRFEPGKFELGDTTNKILTSANAALYAILSSIIHSLGYSPYIGFIHSGSPLPFVYDLADLYKDDLCIDLAFSLTLKMAGRYDRDLVIDSFRERVQSMRLMEKAPEDIQRIMWGSRGRRSS